MIRMHAPGVFAHERSPVLRALSALVLLALLALSLPAQNPIPRKPVNRPAPKYRPDRVLVRFRPGVNMAAMSDAHAHVQGKVLRSYHSVPRLQAVQLPRGLSVPAALRLYRHDRNVLYAEPDYRVQADVTPNDPLFSLQWALNNTGQNLGTPGDDIHAIAAWNITTGSSDVVIGTLDSGIDYTHPDLVGNLHALESDCSNGIDDDGNGYVDDCYGINAITGSSTPFDDYFHGTAVAGVIGAKGNNGAGVTGIDWNVGLVACKFLDNTGGGYTSDAVACLDYFKDLKDNHGLNLVATNNSWGGTEYNQALYDAIDGQRQSGILFIAAAGNFNFDNDSASVYPANYYLPNVLSVAATDERDLPAAFSDYGKRTVHLGAPGVHVESTVPLWYQPGNPYGSFNGTSLAAPQVTGVAALLKAQDPTRDWRAIKNLILAGGDARPASLANTITRKRLSAFGALTCSDSPVFARLRPLGGDIVQGTVGGQVLISALNINCAAPAGDVTVTVQPGGTLTLKDDGVAPDQVAGDGIYSAYFVVPANGTYALTMPDGDKFTIAALQPYFYQPAPYDYRTIAGTNLRFHDDDVAMITPGFPIPFGGGSFDHLWVSSNGTISFDSGFGSNFASPLPVSSIQSLVSPMWADFLEYDPATGAPSDTQNVFWKVVGSAPNRELVIEWRDVYLYCPATDDYDRCLPPFPDETVRFEVVFFESKSDVLFNYADTEFGGNSSWADYGAGASVGIQTANDTATQFSLQTPSLENNVALLWTTTGPNVSNPAPVISSLSPASLATAADFTLTVIGTGFTNASVVRWNGTDRATTFVDSTHLQANITAADLPYIGAYSVNVFNFAGGLSNTATFSFGPTALSLDPSSLPAGSGALTLTVTGTNFEAGDVVLWNGTALTTTFVSSTQLKATVPATNIASPGTAWITIRTPGGVVSNGALHFTILAPAVSSISPNALLAGSPGFTLTVNGSNFVPNSVVLLSGMARPTTFVSSTQLTAAISVADVAFPFHYFVAVQNSSAAVSNGVDFIVLGPTLSSLSPSSATAGGAAFTLTVNGSNFVAGSTVRWNDVARPTTYVSAAQLTAAIPATDLIAAGTIMVSVLNPGGASSNSLPFTINPGADTGLRLVPVAACRIADTRNPNGPFGGPFLTGGALARAFYIPNSACGIPMTAQAYAINVTVVPHGPLGYLTMFPCGQAQPFVSTLNSLDGRIKAVGAIVPAGTSGGICAFATNDTDLVLDVNGYFASASAPSSLSFYPLAPCRLVDTRNGNGPLGGPALNANQARTFPLLSSSCNVPATAQAYSLNMTAVPRGPLGYLTTWAAGQPQPFVSTLNAPTGATTANAAIVPAGTNGDLSVFVTNTADLVIDINGYFAPPAAGGLSYYNVQPCRVLDTRNPTGTPPFNGTIHVNVDQNPCLGSATGSQAYVFNATVVPPSGLGYLTLWPDGASQPLVSTLNAIDGVITSNMAIVPTSNGWVSAYASNNTHLVLDIAGYFAAPPGSTAPVISNAESRPEVQAAHLAKSS